MDKSGEDGQVLSPFSSPPPIKHFPISPMPFSDQRKLLYFIVALVWIGQMVGSGSTASSSSAKRRIVNSGKTMQEWDDIFQQRTDDDWRKLWHKEYHRRCQHQLLSHMDLVCEKDIYKLVRKKREIIPESELEAENQSENGKN